ncbi:MAG: flagellar basal body rod protein FlgB [Chthonomonadales bacterium]
MLDRILEPKAFQAASAALDGLSARHAAIADNIANVNTPGYKRKDVVFEAQLAEALQSSRPGSRLPQLVPQVVRDTATTLRTDGNNVDIEREAVALAENSIRYEAITEYVANFFINLKQVINGAK